MKLEAGHKQWLRAKTLEATKVSPFLKKLNSTLLRIGGEAAVLWNGSNSKTFVEILLKVGEQKDGRGSRLRLGEPGQCHDNSIKLQKRWPTRYKWHTGYALNEDGIWRPHSWAKDLKTGQIVETTESRTIYFGVPVFWED